MTTFAIYAGAALAEIAGCFAVWAWMRQGASPLWLLPGLAKHGHLCLASLAPSAFAGRACAACGGVYVMAPVAWLWVIDGQRPDLWDIVAAATGLAGAAVILGASRAA